MFKNIAVIFAKVAIFLLPQKIVAKLKNKYIYQPRIKQLKVGNNHTPLFGRIYFEVRTRCNGNCDFCAASMENEKRADTTMPFSSYKKVIDELSEIDYSGRVAYHVNNDPLIFSELEQYCDYARKSLPKAWIEIRTNGKALTKEKVESLISAGINELKVNDYSSRQSQKVANAVESILNEVIPVYCDYNKDSNAYVLKDSKRELIVSYNDRDTHEVLSSRGGTSPNKKSKPEFSSEFCEHPFYQFNITTDGRVSKCCADLYFSEPMGNINQEKVLDIWYGEKFKAVRSKLFEGDRKMRLCEECDYYGVRCVNTRLGQIIYSATK